MAVDIAIRLGVAMIMLDDAQGDVAQGLISTLSTAEGGEIVYIADLDARDAHWVGTYAQMSLEGRYSQIEGGLGTARVAWHPVPPFRLISSSESKVPDWAFPDRTLVLG